MEKGDVEKPCAACEGSGVERCPGCNGAGRKRCARCKGTGRVEVKTFGRGGGTEWARCRPDISCAKCKGSATVYCKTCKGNRTFRAVCPGCGGARRTRCSACWGTGKVDDPVAKEQIRIERGIAAEAAGGQAKRLRAIRGSLTRCELDWEGHKERARRVFAAFDAAKARVDAMSDAGEIPKAMIAEREGLQAQGRQCEGSRKTLQEASERIDGLLLEAVNWKKEIAGLLEKLDASPAPLPPEIISAQLDRADALRENLEGFSGELRRLDREVEVVQQRSVAFEKRSRWFREKTEADRLLSEAKLQAFARVETRFSPLAEDLGLMQADVKLLESPSAGELHVEVRSFDPATLVPEETKDPEAAEEALRPLPEFATRLFESCPDVSRLRLAIEADHVSETGHPVRRILQRFTFDRGRWAELVTGKYRDDWMMLLAKSHPVPEYPRPGTSLPDGFPIMLLGMAAVLGLAVLFVIRARMAS